MATLSVSDPISAILTTADKVLSAVLPDKAQKDAASAQLAQMVVTGEIQQQAQELSASMQTIQSVNATMQAESKSEHWLQWAWRPLCGLTLAVMVFNNYVLLPYLGVYGVKVIDIPDKVWQTLLAVVGVSALTRGAEKVLANVDLSAIFGKKDAKAS